MDILETSRYLALRVTAETYSSCTRNVLVIEIGKVKSTSSVNVSVSKSLKGSVQASILTAGTAQSARAFTRSVAAPSSLPARRSCR